MGDGARDQRAAGAEAEREAILALIQTAAWRCRQMPPRQEDEGCARLRAIAEIRQEILKRGTPTTGA